MRKRLCLCVCPRFLYTYCSIANNNNVRTWGGDEMQELCAPMHMIEPRPARDSQLHCKSSLPGEIMDTVSTHSLAVNRKGLCVIDEYKQRQGFSCHGSQQKPVTYIQSNTRPHKLAVTWHQSMSCSTVAATHVTTINCRVNLREYHLTRHIITQSTTQLAISKHVICRNNKKWLPCLSISHIFQAGSIISITYPAFLSQTR